MTNTNVNIIDPKKQLRLFGYKDYFDSFAKLFIKNKMPNSILITGMKGFGKSTFVYHFANYILSKEEFENIDDKDAINGYIKYRNNYYICPRIWDAVAEKPISVEDFIANGNRSPYTNGKAIPYNKRNKQ